MGNAISTVTVGPTASGCLIRLSGRGTLRESRVVKDIAVRTLRHDATAVVTLDLVDCAYVDSTFLGTLIDLHRTADGKRFSIAAPIDHRNKLLGVARLDKLIPGIDTPPAIAGAMVPVPALDASPREILRHVMECHQRLAEVDSPMRPIFARIAAQVERELAESQ